MNCIFYLTAWKLLKWGHRLEMKKTDYLSARGHQMFHLVDFRAVVLDWWRLKKLILWSNCRTKRQIWTSCCSVTVCHLNCFQKHISVLSSGTSRLPHCFVCESSRRVKARCASPISMSVCCSGAGKPSFMQDHHSTAEILIIMSPKLKMWFQIQVSGHQVHLWCSASADCSQRLNERLQFLCSLVFRESTPSVGFLCFFSFWPVSVHFVCPCSVPPNSPFVLRLLLLSVHHFWWNQSLAVCFYSHRHLLKRQFALTYFCDFVRCFASFPACDSSRPAACRWSGRPATEKQAWISKKSKRLKNICFISSDDS